MCHLLALVLPLMLKNIVLAGVEAGKGAGIRVWGLVYRAIECWTHSGPVCTGLCAPAALGSPGWGSSHGCRRSVGLAGGGSKAADGAGMRQLGAGMPCLWRTPSLWWKKRYRKQSTPPRDYFRDGQSSSRTPPQQWGKKSTGPPMSWETTYGA